MAANSRVTWLRSSFPGLLLPRGSGLQGRVAVQPATELLTLRGRIEFGLVDEGGQVRGLWIVLFVSLQVHRHARPLLVGDRQLLLVGCVDHRGDDGRRFRRGHGGGVLPGEGKLSLLSSSLRAHPQGSGPPLTRTGPCQIPLLKIVPRTQSLSAMNFFF